MKVICLMPGNDRPVSVSMPAIPAIEILLNRQGAESLLWMIRNYLESERAVQVPPNALLRAAGGLYGYKFTSLDNYLHHLTINRHTLWGESPRANALHDATWQFLRGEFLAAFGDPVALVLEKGDPVIKDSALQWEAESHTRYCLAPGVSVDQIADQLGL